MSFKGAIMKNGSKYGQKLITIKTKDKEVKISDSAVETAIKAAGTIAVAVIEAMLKSKRLK